jgi:uncharacterized membrane protein YgdD (TMEM256/DUF423 family)
MNKKIILSGIAFSGTAVILGALNAHYLKAFFTSDLTESFATGVRYQMYHGLALISIGALYQVLSTKVLNQLNLLFSVGTILFSWSIYILCAFKSNGIIGLTGLGILTPIGGLVLIIAWAYFFIQLLKKK